MAHELETLLFRIRDGEASSEELQAARTLVQGEVRLPDDLREVVDFSDDPVGDAVGLLAVLGADTLFGEVLREGVAAELAAGRGPTLEASNREEIVLDEVWPLGELFVAALQDEAGTVELVRPVFAALNLELPALLLAEAIRDEAGTIELTEVLQPLLAEGWISSMVDGELSATERQLAVQRLREHPEAGATMTAFASLGSDLRAAVADEAGEAPFVWHGVAAALGIDAEAVLGWDGAQFAAAVRDEAGSVQVADAVLARITRPLPSMISDPVQVPEPANDRRWSGLIMVLAAAAVLLFAVPRGWNTGPSVGPGVDVATVQFASAGEIVVDHLEYGDHSNVYEVMGDQGALILWVDEGNLQ